MSEGKECGMYKAIRYFTRYKNKKIELTKEEFKTMSYYKWLYGEEYMELSEKIKRGKK